jgi:hypothetical protein
VLFIKAQRWLDTTIGIKRLLTIMILTGSAGNLAFGFFLVHYDKESIL